MKLQWYALRSKPRKEQVLYNQLQARDIEVFYPRVRVNPTNPRAARVRSYFPGYMSIRIDIEALGKNMFQWMPFSAGLVEFGGVPAVVPESLIVSLDRRLDAINEAGGLISKRLKPGTAVRIAEGPVKGYAAVFDSHLSGDERVRVVLKLLNDRKLVLDMQAGQIELLDENENGLDDQ